MWVENEQFLGYKKGLEGNDDVGNVVLDQSPAFHAKPRNFQCNLYDQLKATR